MRPILVKGEGVCFRVRDDGRVDGINRKMRRVLRPILVKGEGVCFRGRDDGQVNDENTRRGQTSRPVAIFNKIQNFFLEGGKPMRKRRPKKAPSFERVAKTLLKGNEAFVVNQFYIEGASRGAIRKALRVGDGELEKIHANAISRITDYLKSFRKDYGAGTVAASIGNIARPAITKTKRGIHV